MWVYRCFWAVAIACVLNTKLQFDAQGEVCLLLTDESPLVHHNTMTPSTLLSIHS